MKTEVREIYKCDHCNKLYQIKNACIIHERGCNKNPDNYRVCLSCRHLEKVEETIYHDTPYGGQNSQEVYLFYCKKIESFLYPPKVEQKENWFETDPVDNKPMLRNCEIYENDDDKHPLP